MTKLAKRVQGLTASATLDIVSRATSLRQQGVDVVNFGAGEPDFETPRHIKQATLKALEENFTRYTPAAGTTELKEAICQKFKADNGLSYEPSQVCVCCGAKHALYNLVQVLCGEGDEVMFGSPYWVSYPEMVRLAEAVPKIVETSEKTRFLLTAPLIAQNLTPRTKAIILNSPSNPVGSAYTPEELKAIAELAVQKELFVISDEIYEKIIFGKKHLSIAALGKEIYERTATVNGVSKTYAMTGFRIGYLAAPVAIAKSIANLQSHSTSNPTSLSQKAAVAALKGDQGEVVRMVAHFKKRRDILYQGLQEIPGMAPFLPEGAFYIFCHISKTGLSSSALATRWLEEAHVAVVPGKGFGRDDYVRFSFATDEAAIREGLRRIKDWVDRARR